MPITGNKNADGLKPKKLPYDPGSMNAHEIEAVNAILLRTTGCHFSKSAYQYMMKMFQMSVADWEPIPIAVEKVQEEVVTTYADLVKTASIDVTKGKTIKLPGPIPTKSTTGTEPAYILHKLPSGETITINTITGETSKFTVTGFELDKPITSGPSGDGLYAPLSLSLPIRPSLLPLTRLYPISRLPERL